jgi:hypothetical protein
MRHVRFVFGKDIHYEEKRRSSKFPQRHNQEPSHACVNQMDEIISTQGQRAASKLKTTQKRISPTVKR